MRTIKLTVKIVYFNILSLEIVSLLHTKLMKSSSYTVMYVIVHVCFFFDKSRFLEMAVVAFILNMSVDI